MGVDGYQAMVTGAQITTMKFSGGPISGKGVTVENALSV
jgi:hypothetical protein